MKDAFIRIAIKIAALALGILALPLVEASERSLLKDLGLKVGESYASAKARLLEKGWKVDMTHVDSMNAYKSPPYGFKEVVCGNGRDASCSARFLRRDQEIMLTMRPNKTLIVDGAWNDK